MRICGCVDLGLEGRHLRGTGLDGVGAERSGLHRNQTGTVALGPVIAGETPLHELASEDGPVGDGDHVADENLSEAGGKRGSVVADLVGVRENHLRGALLLD